MSDDVKRVSPSIREKKRAEAEAAKAKEEAEFRRFQKDLAETFDSDAGKRVLKWLYHRCLGRTSLVGVNVQSHTVDVETTLYNAARRNVYLELTEHLEPRILKEVEYD